MMINTKTIVPMTDANQNFSKVVHLVEENGMAVIMKNNKPRYIVVNFEEYDAISTAMQMRKEKINCLADKILEDNMETMMELAK